MTPSHHWNASSRTRKSSHQDMTRDDTKEEEEEKEKKSVVDLSKPSIADESSVEAV